MAFFDNSSSDQDSGVEFRIDLSGVKQAMSKLEQLPDRLSRKILRKAMSKSLNLLTRDVRATAPVGKTGNLKKSIRKRANFAKSKSGWLWGEVYASAPHSHLIERGWKLTAHQKQGKRFLKRIEGRRFMRSAAQKNAGAIK